MFIITVFLQRIQDQSHIWEPSTSGDLFTLRTGRRVTSLGTSAFEPRRNRCGVAHTSYVCDYVLFARTYPRGGGVDGVRAPPLAVVGPRGPQARVGPKTAFALGACGPRGEVSMEPTSAEA